MFILLLFILISVYTFLLLFASGASRCRIVRFERKVRKTQNHRFMNCAQKKISFCFTIRLTSFDCCRALCCCCWDSYGLALVHLQIFYISARCRKNKSFKPVNLLLAAVVRRTAFGAEISRSSEIVVDCFILN